MQNTNKCLQRFTARGGTSSIFLPSNNMCILVCLCFRSSWAFSLLAPSDFLPAGTKVKPNLAFDNDSTLLSRRKQHFLTARTTSRDGAPRNSRWVCPQGNFAKLAGSSWTQTASSHRFPLSLSLKLKSHRQSSSISPRRAALMWDSFRWKSLWKATGLCRLENQKLLERICPCAFKNRT